MIGNQRVNKILCRNVLKTNKKINTELKLLNEMNNEHTSNNNILPNIEEEEFKIKLNNTTIKKSSPVNKEYTMISLPIANTISNHHADRLFDDNYVSESDDLSNEKDCVTLSNNKNILTSPNDTKNNNESEPRPELLLDDIE